MTNIPVATTLMGKGAMDETHPLALGTIGMHGRNSANKTLVECDCLITIGCRFSDRSVSSIEDFTPNATRIQIDVDPAEIGKTIEIDIPIVGDAKVVLTELIEHV